MTPQSSFMVLAPVIDGKRAELRALLASMNQRAGRGRPRERAGAVRPLRAPARRALRRARGADRGRHRGLRHGARAVAAFARLPRRHRRPGRQLSCTTSSARAEPGLRRIFAHCQDFSAERRPARLDAARTSGRRPPTTSTGSAAPCARCARSRRCTPCCSSALQQRRRTGAGRASGRAARPARPLRRRRAPGRPPELTPPRSRRRSGWRLRNIAAHVRRAGRAAGAGAVPADRLARAALHAAPAREDRSRHRRRIPAAITSGARPSSRTTRSPTSSPCSATSSPAGSAAGLTVFLLWLLDYVGAPHLQPRLPDPGPDHPFRPLGVSRRPQAAVLRQQLRRQRRELHGRLHQQGRLGHQPRVQQRRRLSRARAG